MMPGMNQRAMKQAMRRMGIQQVEVDASEVIIRTPEHDIIIKNPQVSKVNMMGQQTYQIVGEEHITKRESKAEISEDDINTVMEQAGVDEKTAKAAIESANGDLAKAIMDLHKE